MLKIFPTDVVRAGMKDQFIKFAGTLLLIFVVAACSSAPPSEDLDFTGPRPEICEDGYITITKKVIVALSPEEFSKWMIETPLEKKMIGDEHISAVERTTLLTETWGEPGSRRQVHSKDGHQSVDEILDIEQGVFQRYIVWGFTNVAGNFADYAIGEFTYFRIDQGTEVQWTYKWHPHSFLTRIPLSLGLKNKWPQYMEKMLHHFSKSAEEFYSKKRVQD